MLIHRARKKDTTIKRVDLLFDGEKIGYDTNTFREDCVIETKEVDVKPIGSIPISKELSQVIMAELEMRRAIMNSLCGYNPDMTIIDTTEKESIPDIVKRFDMKPLKPIPINELTNEEIEDADKKFISRLIDIFKGIQNKG